MQVLDHGVQIEALELLSVVERLSHRIGQGRVLVQNLQVELVRPPARIRRGPGHRVSANANVYGALGFGWIIGDSRGCRCEFFLHLLILLRISQKNIAMNCARSWLSILTIAAGRAGCSAPFTRHPRVRTLRHLTGSAPRSALRAEPPENEFAFAKNPLTEGTRGRPRHVVPLHILNIAAAVANEMVMPLAFRIESRGAALDGHLTHQTRLH